LAPPNETNESESNESHQQINDKYSFGVRNVVAGALGQRFHDQNLKHVAHTLALRDEVLHLGRRDDVSGVHRKLRIDAVSTITQKPTRRSRVIIEDANLICPNANEEVAEVRVGFDEIDHEFKASLSGGFVGPICVQCACKE
jgi:hypothetical protein